MTDSAPTTEPWFSDQQTVDETEFTPWANKGWMAWNGQSPETDVCRFVQSLVTMMQPRLVIETGVGQGYMTRAIVPALRDGQHLAAYESDAEWRSMLWPLPFWVDNRFVVSLSPDPSPADENFLEADLCVLDSEFSVRMEEIERWHGCSKHGSVALIHDAGEHHDETTIHSAIHDLIVDLGIAGFFMHNPRGSFLAVKQ